MKKRLFQFDHKILNFQSQLPFTFQTIVFFYHLILKFRKNQAIFQKILIKSKNQIQDRKNKIDQEIDEKRQVSKLNNNNEIIDMSLIIEDELFVIQKKQLQKSKIHSNNQTNIIKKFLSLHDLNHKNIQTFVFSVNKNEGNKTLKLIIPFKKKIFDLFDLWYSVDISHDSFCKQQKFTISKDQLPFHITPFKKKLQAIREINRSRQFEPKFIKVYINQKGSIQCILPKIVLNENLASTFRFSTKTSTKNLSFSLYVENMLKLVISDTKDTFKNLFNRLFNANIQQETIVKQNLKETEQNFIKFQLFRYLARSSIQLRFDCTQGSALYQQVVDITMTEEKQIQERISCMKQANLFKMSSLSLYMQFHDIFQGKQKQSFYMSAKEKQMTKNLLQIPQILPIKQAFGTNNPVIQNKYMYNSIILELPHENQKLNLLGESGFGKIQFGSFNFWYLNNSKTQFDIEQCIRQTYKIKNKYLVVKSPKQTNDLKARRKYDEKQFHEIQIVNRLKGLSCALIPRFYKVQYVYPEAFSELQKSYVRKYEKSLLSELTTCYGQPGYNLGNLITDRWNSLTLKKIIFIMSQVAQALRFLHLNKIVHLDLKPENILFLKNFAIKLIDFGEAYHPLVPYQDTTPAYTYPYGCPQIAQQCQSFSDKSDVFSFGIILYQLLYGRDIISTSPQCLLRKYRDKLYFNKIFFNPQQLYIYGQNLVLPMLNHLIIKALSPDVQLRPSITWISVLLKNYLEILP